MSLLYQELEKQVDAWRAENYACDDYPAIREILEFAVEDDGSRRFLRSAQLKALESYWYLRLVQGTPTVPQLYAQFFPKLGDRREAMGVTREVFESVDYDFDALAEKLLSCKPLPRCPISPCSRTKTTTLMAKAAW